MEAYILGIAGAVLISATITIIAPNGKMGKFMKGAMKLFIIIVLVAPFVQWLGSGDFSFGASDGVALDAQYMRACAERLAEEDERAIRETLKEEFSVEGEAEVVRRADAGFTYEKIKVKISDFGISGQGEHKDITGRVQAFLTEKYRCPAEVS